MYAGTLKAATNRADWQDGFKLLDATGAVVDLTGAEVTLTLADRETKRAKLTIKTSDYVTVDANGVIRWNVPVENMRSLCAETYDLGMVLKINGATKQLIVGRVPVLDGIVP